MNYRVRRRGEDLGVFTIEQLRERRASGEFTGNEYVQAEGMNDWQPLNLVLQQGYIKPPPLPPFASASARPNLTLVWATIIIGMGLFIVIMAAFMWNLQRGFSAAFRQPLINLNKSAPQAVATAKQPLVWNAHSLTAVDWQKRAGEFRIHEWLDGYEQRGRRDPECDAEIVEFLQTWIARNYGGDAATNPISLAAESDKLAGDPKCTDPLVLTVVANETLNSALAMERYERALATFPGSSHRAYPNFYAAVCLARFYNAPSDRMVSLDSTALDLLPKCFSDGSFIPGDQQEIADIFVNGWGAEFFSRNPEAVCKIADDAGPDFHWLALVLKGENEKSRAWQERNNNWTQMTRQTFYKEMTLARNDFTEAWNLETNYPLAPAAMIEVSLGDSDITEMRKWFDRATIAQVDYPGAWTEMIWGYNPECYGNEEAILDFGRTAVNSGRFDTGIPRKYIECVYAVESEMSLQRGHHIFGRSDIWPEFQKIYPGYLSAPSQVKDRNGWRTSYAVVAYYAGHYDVAGEQLEALNWHPRQSILAEWKLDATLWPLEIAARSGPLGDKISRAETLYQDGDYAGALKIYKDLDSKSGTDSRTKEFIQLRLMAMGSGKYTFPSQFNPQALPVPLSTN
jgi:hypothetical protein